MNASPLPASQRGAETLGSQIRRGAGWMALFKVSERTLGLISILVLARLLTPLDFGLVAMAMSVVALTELMGAFGFDVALIQRRNADAAHYDTAWTFNVLFGVGIALLLLTLTLPAATFYREPRLHWVLPVLALGALLQSFENVGTVNFRKELDFRREFRFLISKKLAGFVVTIALAVTFRNYWALVIGTVAGKAFSVGISYYLHPYRPRFTLAARHDLLHFSKWLFFLNLTTVLQNKSADFILGRTIGPHGLGIYNVSFEIAALPSTEFVAPLNRAVYPAYAKLAADLPELRRRFLTVFSIIALIAFPASTGLACVAAPAVLVLLGQQWVDAIPLLRILTVAGLVGALQSNLHLVLLALGKPRANTLISAVAFITSLPVFIVASLQYGLIGAAWAYLAYSFVSICAVHFVFFRVTRLSLIPYLSVLWRPIAASACLAVAVLYAEHWMGAAYAGLGSPWKLLSLILTGALTYAISLFAMWWLSGKPTGAEMQIIDTLRKVPAAWLAPEGHEHQVK